MFSLRSFVCKIFHISFRPPPPWNSLWNFSHVLDNKFIWISGFELSWIIGGVALVRSLAGWCTSTKNMNEKILKFPRRICGAWSRVASNDGGFSSRFISWILFSLLHARKETEKWKVSAHPLWWFFAARLWKPQTNERKAKNLCGLRSEKNLVELLILIY